MAIIIHFSAIPVARAQNGDEFKPNGKIFGLLFTNFHTTFSGGDNSPAFEVTRSYLGFDYSFSETIASRVMYDGTTEIINGKTIYSGYLRNAYLQYDDGTLTVRGGLIGAEQIVVMDKMWNYRFITRPAIDYSGMIFSADLGLMAKVKAGEMVVFDVEVTNGRGFKDIAGNGTYRFSGGFAITPLDNLLFRGYYDMMGPSGRRQRTASLAGAYMSPGLTVGAEYLMQNNNLMVEGANHSGLSIFTTVKLAEKVSLFGRYDNIGSVILEGESEPWNVVKDGARMYLGIDLSPARNVRISPNFIGYIPDETGEDFEGTVGLNVEAKF